MKRSAGFTLIELVIVIVILGILAVTAAPKFLNLQSDAREGVLKGVEASMKGASSLVYSKSVIAGVESKVSGAVKVNGNNVVDVVYGYPRADEVVGLLDISATSSASATGGFDFYYKLNSTTDVSVWPLGSDYTKAACSVKFTNSASTGTQPVIVTTTGC